MHTCYLCIGQCVLGHQHDGAVTMVTMEFWFKNIFISDWTAVTEPSLVLLGYTQEVIHKHSNMKHGILTELWHD